MWYRYKRFCTWTSRTIDKSSNGMFGLIVMLMLGMMWITVSGMFFAFSVLYGLFYSIRWLFCKIFKIERKPRKITGYDYEERVAKSLREKGYRNVIVTPKSGDYGADIVATNKHGEKICFQCKYYNGSVGISAVQEVNGAKSHYGCTKAAVITNSKFTKAAKELANDNDIDLFECYEALFY